MFFVNMYFRFLRPLRRFDVRVSCPVGRGHVSPYFCEGDLPMHPAYVLWFQQKKNLSLGWHTVAWSAVGIIASVGFVFPSLWFVQQMAVALCVYALCACRGGEALRIGWAFGAGWFIGGMYWLYYSLTDYGGLSGLVAVGCIGGVAVVLAFPYALVCAGWAQWRRGAPLIDGLSFGLLWYIAEWARTTWYFSFPWVQSGVAYVDSPLAVWLPWIGGTGVGALAIGCSAAGGVALHAWRHAQKETARMAVFRHNGLPLLAIAACYVISLFVPVMSFTTPTKAITVALVQTNVSQKEKIAHENIRARLENLEHALFSATADVVFSPETAVPLPPSRLESYVPGWWDPFVARLSASPQQYVIGILEGSRENGYQNNLLGVGHATPLSRYTKKHLVPFGEYVPYGFGWFMRWFQAPIGTFVPRQHDALSYVVKKERIALTICFEDAFGAALARRFDDAKTAPTLLANVSNVGWFGDSAVLPQHRQIARLRAIELQRPFVRAANTGPTLVVDAYGTVTATLPAYTEATLTATVQGREGRTPYARLVSPWGETPFVLLAVLLLVGLWRKKGK